MLELDSIMHLVPSEEKDMPIDYEFITDFLQPFFPEIPRTELRAKVCEIVGANMPSTPLRPARDN